MLDPSSLALLGSFAQGEVSEPHDVVFQADGKLLVADTGNSRIAIYDVSGATGTFTGNVDAGNLTTSGDVAGSTGTFTSLNNLNSSDLASSEFIVECDH